MAKPSQASSKRSSNPSRRMGYRMPHSAADNPIVARRSRRNSSYQRFVAMRLVVRTNANTLELVPSIRYSADTDAEVEMSLWAVPGGGRMTTQEIRAVCVRNGWSLCEPGLDKSKPTTPRKYVWPQYG